MFPSALVLSLKRILILVTRRNMTYLRKFFFFFFQVHKNFERSENSGTGKTFVEKFRGYTNDTVRS